MEINADFSRRAKVHAARLEWAPSPVPGVDRRMLDRIGGEVARATSIVRYAPASVFSPHTHGGGEEILVLEGVFQDEHGDFPAGSYLRNPPASRHTPRSDAGCVIFVKLWQFQPEDRVSVRVDCVNAARLPDARRPGVLVTPLFRDAHEDVRIEEWSPGLEGGAGDAGGVELLVLEGSFEADGETFAPLSWLRLPPGDSAPLRVGPAGVRLWVKSGHLERAPGPPFSAARSNLPPGS